jgi:hypothetical protein
VGTNQIPPPVSQDDDSKSDFRSVLKKYASKSSDEDDDTDSSDSGSQDSLTKQDPSRTLAIPVHVLQPMHEVLPLIAQNIFIKVTDTIPSPYTAATPANTAAPLSTTDASDPAPTVDQPRPAPPPMIEATDPPPAPSSAPVAFAAKLTPVSDETSAPPPRNTAPQSGSPQKQPATSSVAAADPDPTPAKPDAVAGIEKLAKIDPATSFQGDAPAKQGDASVKKDAATPNTSAIEKMQPLMEAPAAPAGSNHDITVRIPDASERAVDVRFVERGGEIHVSVRSGDAETAQTLRSGLNDFVGKMDHAGIRAEVWRPGADASSPQNNSQNQSDQRDQRGSGRNQSGSPDRDDRDQQQSNKPKWVEALEKAGSPAV